MTVKRFLTMFSMALLAVVLTACGADSTNGEGGSGNEGNGGNGNEQSGNEENAGGNDADTYIVATDNSFVPFEFVGEDSGELQGFDIDLMTAVAEEAGFDIEFKTMDFKGIIPGLKSNRWDMGIAGISITEERAKSIDYSDPYYESGIIVAVQADNTAIQGIDDLAGKKVSTRQGSTSENYLKDNVPEADVVSFPKITQGYQELAAGRVDATLYDEPNLKYYIQTNAKGKIKTVGEKLTAEDYGIAFQKGSDLVDDVNEALQTIKENGTYDDIYEKWFGEKPE